MNDLDALLAESTADLDNVERARRKLRKFNVGEEEAFVLRKLISGYEEKHNWQSTALILLIQRQTCSCGAVHHLTLGQYLRQNHVRLFRASRLIVNNWPNCSLPRLVEYHDSVTGLCVDCAEGWA